jgi:hypothetical protein
MNVLRNLKRVTNGKDKKRDSTPLNKSCKRSIWSQWTLETTYGGADVADAYYPAFLINGKQSI